MRHAKPFSLVVIVLVLCYGALGYYFLPYARFQGDLTRMGMLPETAFGWRKVQPAVDQKWLAQSSMRDADVLVIGDSFSNGRMWQSVLTRHGYKVRTEHWDSMRAICGDFSGWLKAQGFQGQYVVLQIIERNIEDGLKKSITCQTMQTHPSVSADKPRHPLATSFDPDWIDRNGRYSVGINTWLNLRKYSHYSETPEFTSALLPNGAKVARVKNGCELFSHTKCSDALFLAEDKAKDIDWSTLDMVEQINQRITGAIPVWAFVPNKSTVYLYPEKRFWDEAEHRFASPNLLRSTLQAVAAKTVDLYPANNTHFSTVGYLLMGEDILNAIRQSESR